MRGYDADNLRRNGHAILCAVNVAKLQKLIGAEQTTRVIGSLKRINEEYEKEKAVYQNDLLSDIKKEAIKQQNQTKEK